MRTELEHKVDLAIRLLRAIPRDCEVELSYSGGKDSDVILELAKMAGIPFWAIYKNTTIDPPGTLKHVRDNGVEVMQPKQPFFKLIENFGLPSWAYRFCCRELKEYKVCDRAIQGIRRSESVKRAKRYKEPEFCRVYSKKDKVRVYLPILEWTDNDVKEFITERGIRCAPRYYDEQGVFHVERRLGCLCCPLMSRRKRIEEFRRYPKMLRPYVHHAQVRLDAHPDSTTYASFDGNACNMMIFNIFCDNMADYREKVNGRGMFADYKINSKEFLEDYFNVKL